MTLAVTAAKLALNKGGGGGGGGGNPWNFFVLLGTDFPAHNRCDLKVWRAADAHDNAHRWQWKVQPSSTRTALVCAVKVPSWVTFAAKGSYGSETLDITVTNEDDATDTGDLNGVPAEIVDETP